MVDDLEVVLGKPAILTADRVHEFCAEGAEVRNHRHRAAIAAGEQRLAAADSPNESTYQARVEIAQHWVALMQYAEALKVLRPILDDDTVPELWTARAQSNAAWADLYLGDYRGAESKLTAAVTVLSPSQYHADLAFCLRALGATCLAKGDVGEAHEHCSGALAAALRDPEHREVRPCLSALGIAEKMAGHYKRSIELHERCLARGAPGEQPEFYGRDKLNIAITMYHLGRFDESASAATDAAMAFRDAKMPFGIGAACIMLARVSRVQADYELASDYASMASELSKETKYKRLEVLAAEEIADTHLATCQARAAADTLNNALKLATKIAPRGDLVYEVSWRLARAYRALGQTSRARQFAESAMELASATADVLEHTLAKQVLAGVEFDIGNLAEARRLIDEVIDSLRRLEASYYLALAHEAAATFALDGEQDERTAIAHLHEAARLYARTGVEHAADAAEARLRKVEAAAGIPPRQADAADGAPGTVIAVSQVMRDVIAMARILGDYENTTLIEGPTGAGKEVIARIIHSSGAWADRPFFPLNCAAVSKHLLESELFGHRRGSFTGAEADRIGYLEIAGDGIVFLDEIDKTDKVFQAKLLRVLEDRRFMPVGENEPRELKARILCASNRGLRQLADSGSFLPDLYFRLAAGRIEVPPLHERPEDTEALAEAFVGQCAERYGVQRMTISRETRVALMTYSWPGNVRELKNVIELATFVARGEKVLKPEHLPAEVSQALARGGQKTLGSKIEELERREIGLALKKTDNSRTDSAKLLGITRKGLLDKLRRLRISDV